MSSSMPLSLVLALALAWWCLFAEYRCFRRATLSRPTPPVRGVETYVLHAGSLSMSATSMDTCTRTYYVQMYTRVAHGVRKVEHIYDQIDHRGGRVSDIWCW